MKKSIIIRVLLSIVIMGFILVAKVNPQDKKNVIVQKENIDSKKKKMAITNKTNSSNNDSTELESGDGSMFDTIKKGGILIIPIVLLGFLGLTLIIERMIFFIRQKAFSREPLKEYIFAIAKNSSTRYKEELEDELRDGVQIYFNNMEKGMALLSGVGNLAPLLGFFGTVVGMIGAFASIAAATTVNAKVVAVGIQTALVTTAGGLSVAVPVLGFYYLFNHFIQKAYAFSDEYIIEATKDKKRMSQG